MKVSKVRKKDLRHHKHQIIELHNNIADILRIIDEKIREAHDKGLCYVKFPLPGLFEIPNMNARDARNRIHSMIISDLTCEERDFLVHYIKTEKNRYILLIRWETDEEVYQKEEEIEILEFYNQPLEQQKNNKDKKPRSHRYIGVESLKNKYYMQ